jgi:Leucine-rich repeat (LRR) protein
LYGITFIDDNHIESIASGCIHLECIALNFCSRFKGHSLKTLLSRCKKIKSLLLQNTAIESEAIKSVEWNQTNLEELDLSSTDLDEQALLLMLSESPNLTYLSVSHCDAFTDHVIFLIVVFIRVGSILIILLLLERCF